MSIALSKKTRTRIYHTCLILYLLSLVLGAYNNWVQATTFGTPGERVYVYMIVRGINMLVLAALFALSQYLARWLLIPALLAMAHIILHDYFYSGQSLIVAIEENWFVCLVSIAIALNRFHFQVERDRTS